MKLSEKAHELVKVAFANKVENGEPYIKHLERVASKFDDDELKTIAYLHDLFEDVLIYTENILYAGLKADFGEEVIDAVRYLTRTEADATYRGYIARVSHNEKARKVKMADLEDNMDLTRYKKRLTRTDIERTLKYHDAYILLKNTK